MRRRSLIWAAMVVVVIACGPAPVPSPVTVPRIVWADRVPVASPEAIANQPVVHRGPDSIILLPISPTGAVVGTDYAYDMPHCGINSAIDADGSFWDAVGVDPSSVDFDGLPGTFRLTSPTEAMFTAPNGKFVRLVRHAGAKEFAFCL